MKCCRLVNVAVVLFSATACSRSRPPQAAAAARGLASDPAQQELARFQGTWQVESSVWNGVPEPPAAWAVTLRFEGNMLIMLDRDGKRGPEETTQLLPDRNPKAIDRWTLDGPAGPGIYSLEGDTLRWCSAGGKNKVRPTAFASEPGSRQSLMVSRRQKG